MKIFGSISRLVSILFRKDSQDITLRPNQSTTYTAARDIQLPPGDAAHVLMSADSTATLTNKTFDADGAGNSISNIENADIKALAAIDATKIHDGSVTNTEFGYIGGLTSDAQTQLNGKASTALSNLASVAINTSLISDTDNTDDLGSAAIGWKEGFVNKVSMDSNSQTTSLQGSASASASVVYSLPPAAPASNGYVLASQTDGTMSWVSNASVSSYKADWTDQTSTVTFTNATNKVNYTSHGLENGQTLYFTNSGGALPAEITANQIYYVINKSANDFEISASYGGSAVDFSDDGTGTNTVNVTSKAFTHGLGSQDLVVQVYDKDDGFEVRFDEVIRISTTHVIVNGTELPGGTGFRVLILAA